MADSPKHRGERRPINTKHINIFLPALAGQSLVHLFLTTLVRISGFSALFSAIALFLSTVVGGYQNTPIAEKREENPEILTNLVRKRLTRSSHGQTGTHPRDKRDKMAILRWN